MPIESIQLTPRQLTDGSMIYNGSCHDVLDKIAPASIHCTVTSPPYDDLRNYKGKWSVDLKRLGEQLKRVTVVGGGGDRRHSGRPQERAEIGHVDSYGRGVAGDGVAVVR